MAPSPAPWTSELDESRRAETTQYVVYDAKGNALFDCDNSMVRHIEADHDETGSHYWDEQGKVNLALAAAPDLLAACQQLKAFVELHTDAKAPDYSRVCLDAVAAIAKATK